MPLSASVCLPGREMKAGSRAQPERGQTLQAGVPSAFSLANIAVRQFQHITTSHFK